MVDPTPMSTYAEFHRLVNMSPRSILAWQQDDRARCASQLATIRRLGQLARLKAKAKGAWTPADARYARKVLGFIKRHEAQERAHGCSYLRTVALRNWGRQTKCPLPATCVRPRRKR